MRYGRGVPRQTLVRGLEHMESRSLTQLGVVGHESTFKNAPRGDWVIHLDAADHSATFRFTYNTSNPIAFDE